MSPDTLSSLFPDRPIRPLPKRKLREKLSPETIQAIEYPAPAVDSIPLFYYPTYSSGSGATSDLVQEAREASQHAEGSSTNHHDAEPAGGQVTGQPIQSKQKPVKHTTRFESGADGQPATFTEAPLYGYDSLENTNNKKKRKIPSASDGMLRGSQLASNESLEGSRPGTLTNLRGHLNAAAYTVPLSHSIHNEAIAGSGRGRLGRLGHSRSPLRTISDVNNTWRGLPLKAEGSPSSTTCETNGIISNAIANAERLPSPGQENVGSLLHRHSAPEKTTPISSRFTFTCGSQVPGSISWPDTSADTSTAAEGTPAANLGHSNIVPAEASIDGKAAREGRPRSRANGRRQLERDLVLAARDRRQAAADAYHHSPPKLEDIWICEFCEYERIFGRPPKALIREYEIKDRRLRREEVDRRRLLEKAKAKSRKARKGHKAGKGTQSISQSPGHRSEDQTVVEAHPMAPSYSHSTQSDIDYEDRVEEYRPRDPPDILGLYGHAAVNSTAET